MSDFGEGITLKTRKAHRCEWCFERIEAGDAAYHYQGKYNGEWQNWYMHPECEESFDINNDDGEFSPGEGERPSRSESEAKNDPRG